MPNSPDAKYDDHRTIDRVKKVLNGDFSKQRWLLVVPKQVEKLLAKIDSDNNNSCQQKV